MVKNKTKDIFDFNYINNENQSIEAIKELYIYYHKKEYCFQKKYEQYKRQALILDALSAIIVFTGSTVTLVTIPVPIVPFISGAVTFLTPGLIWIKNRKKWIEKSQNFRQSTAMLNKILIDLRSHLREKETDFEKLKSSLLKFDEEILEICPIPNIGKYEKEYVKKFQ